MRRRRPHEGAASARRQRGVLAAPIVLAGAAFDEALFLEPIERTGQPASREERLVGEGAQPDPPRGRLGEDEEHPVRGEREAARRFGLTVQRPGDHGVGAHERAPGAELVLTQPPLSDLWNKLRRQPFDGTSNYRRRGRRKY